MLHYYKRKESFRDVLGRVHTRVMLTPGYLPDLCCDEIVQIRRGLTYLMEQRAFIPEQPTLFPTDSVFNDSRQLKTDLELRPMNHQSDENSDAHLFFGLLAYWIVNTIRYKLKQHGITHYWTEIKRILSTQKAITTEADNALGDRVEMRLCSDPTDSAADLYRALSYTPRPFRRYHIYASDPPPEKSVVPTRKSSKRNCMVCKIISGDKR